MGRTYKVVVGLLVLAGIGYGGWYLYQSHRVQATGILRENVVRDGDIWTADFIARIEAPEPQVFDAIENVESSHSDQVKDVKVVAQGLSTKTVDMTIDGPGGQPIVTRLKFDFDQPGRRISYQTIDNPLLDTHAQYNLTDEGATTLVTFHQTTRMMQEMPVPDALVKGVIRSIFVAQLQGLRKSLNLPETQQAAGDSDEE